MPKPDRGDVWLVDLGIAAKVRPCVVLSVSPSVHDRALITLVPHTTSVRATNFEVSIPKSFLKPGAFDVQGLVTVAPPRLVRKLGELQPAEVRSIENAVQRWLGL
jgi:mRNA interferase MazF